LGRRRFASHKRPDNRSFEKEHLDKGTTSESKGKHRYKTKPTEEEDSNGKRRNFFNGLEYQSESKEQTSQPKTIKNLTLNNRSCTCPVT
jgi:hypothetical protein